MFISGHQLLREADLQEPLPDRERQRLMQSWDFLNIPSCLYVCSTQNNSAYRLRGCFPPIFLYFLLLSLLTKPSPACKIHLCSIFCQWKPETSSERTLTSRGWSGCVQAPAPSPGAPPAPWHGHANTPTAALPLPQAAPHASSSLETFVGDKRGRTQNTGFNQSNNKCSI